MKKIFIYGVLFCLLTFTASAQNGIFRIAGKIANAEGEINIRLLQVQANAMIGTDKEVDFTSHKTDKYGRFDIVAKVSSVGSYLTVENKSGNYFIVSDVPIFAGDSVFLDISPITNTKGGERHCDLKASGFSAAKFQLSYDLKSIPDIRDNEPFNLIPDIYAGRIKSCDSIVQSYKDKIPQSILQTIRSNAFARIRIRTEAALRVQTGYSAKLNLNTSEKYYKAIKQLNEKLPRVESAIISSIFYTRQLVDNTTAKFMVDTHSNAFYYEDFYKYINQHYKGALFERMLSYTLGSDLYQYFADYKDRTNYSVLLRDGVTKVADTYFKSKLDIILKTRANGAEPLNFTMLLDSTSKTVRLSDFKGKVVLFDLWPFHCGGCQMFANVFHKEVFPLFKTNPNFVVISAAKGTEGFTQQRYVAERLKEINKPAYTFNDYTNLYSPAYMTEKILDYYETTSAPFILLIGKDGKIYECKVPFFTLTGDPNIGKLKTLIQKALDQPKASR